MATPFRVDANAVGRSGRLTSGAYFAYLVRKTMKELQTIHPTNAMMFSRYSCSLFAPLACLLVLGSSGFLPACVAPDARAGGPPAEAGAPDGTVPVEVSPPNAAGVADASTPSAPSAPSADASSDAESDASAPEASSPVIGYTGSGATAGPSEGGGILNIGRSFHVVETGITLRQLGVWDEAEDGLASSHTVTLFSLDQTGASAVATPVPGGATTVPAGTVAPLRDGFRYAPLAAPLPLPLGAYAVVTYGLNAQDPYGLGGNIPVATTGIVSDPFDPYEWIAAPSPTYPLGGDTTDHSSVSILYDSPGGAFTRIMPYGDSITDGLFGTNAGYLGYLDALLTGAGVPHQFVGVAMDNTGTLGPDQIHHEGHPGLLIQGGNGAPRAGIADFASQWLGPGGVDPDVILLMIGTNDVDTGYDLANAGARLSALISLVLDAKTGLRPRARMIVAQITPIVDAAEDGLAQTYNTQVTSVVANHAAMGESVSLVDMHSAVNVATDMSNNLHPNDGGY